MIARRVTESDRHAQRTAEDREQTGFATTNAASCRRLAPIEARIAISPARAAPRANSRFAMLTHTINNTNTVIPSNNASGAPANRPSGFYRAARARR